MSDDRAVDLIEGIVARTTSFQWTEEAYEKAIAAVLDFAAAERRGVLEDAALEIMRTASLPEMHAGRESAISELRRMAARLAPEPPAAREVDEDERGSGDGGPAAIPGPGAAACPCGCVYIVDRFDGCPDCASPAQPATVSVAVEDLRAALRYALDYCPDDEDDLHGIGPRNRGDVYGYDRVMDAAFGQPAADRGENAHRPVPDGFRGDYVRTLGACDDGNHRITLEEYAFDDGSSHPYVRFAESHDGYVGERLLALDAAVHLARNVGDEEAWTIGNREPAQPTPVTYRAGTVPPLVRVGMVLRSRATDLEWTVTGTSSGMTSFEATRGFLTRVFPMCRDDARWPLARDWTEPGGSNAEAK